MNFHFYNKVARNTECVVHRVIKRYHPGVSLKIYYFTLETHISVSARTNQNTLEHRFVFRLAVPSHYYGLLYSFPRGVVLEGTTTFTRLDTTGDPLGGRWSLTTRGPYTHGTDFMIYKFK